MPVDLQDLDSADWVEVTDTYSPQQADPIARAVAEAIGSSTDA